MNRLMTCLWLLLCLVPCAAQNKKKSFEHSPVNLSGTWELDKSKSKLRDKQGSITLTVSQHEPEIRITRKSTLDGIEKNQELVYYSDGRGERNPSLFRNELTESDSIGTTTKWDKGKLVVKATYVRKSRGGSFEMEVTDKWELSSDGMTLTKTTKTDAPRRVLGNPDMILVVFDQSPIKIVFNRVREVKSDLKP